MSLQRCSEQQDLQTRLSNTYLTCNLQLQRKPVRFLVYIYVYATPYTCLHIHLINFNFLEAARTAN